MLEEDPDAFLSDPGPVQDPGIPQPVAKKPGSGNALKALLPALGIGALAGGLGGNTGVAMSPILALLAQLATKQKSPAGSGTGSLNTTAKTPPFWAGK